METLTSREASPCARCGAPVAPNQAGGLSHFHALGASITCGSTALLHTLDAELAAATNYEFRSPGR